jgi:hypothetical protein
MIEIAPNEYWKYLTLEDAVLYCFSLNIDNKIHWRLPTEEEFYDKIIGLDGGAWDQSEFVDREELRTTKLLRRYSTHKCIPVRDIQSTTRRLKIVGLAYSHD